MSLVDVYGFDFNGSTRIKSANIIAIDNYFTVLFNIKRTSINAEYLNARILNCRATNYGERFDFLCFINNGVIKVLVMDGDIYTSYSYLSSSKTIEVGEYAEVYFIYNNGNVKLSVNGVVNEMNVTVPTLWSNYVLTIGVDGWDNKYFLKSIVNDVKIYNTALTINEINEAKQGDFGNPILYYKLEDDIIDYSGNNNNGIVTGTEQYGIIRQIEPPLPYSKLNLYIEPFNYNTNFVYKNKTVAGNNSIAQWQFDDEYPNRLNEEYVLVSETDTMVIENIKSLDYNTTIQTNVFRLHLESGLSGNIDLYGIFEDGSFSVIQTLSSIGFVENQYFDVDLNGINNLSKLAFTEPSIGFRLYLDTDIDIVCFDDNIRVNVENINVGVETNIKSFKTLDNKIFTNKINKTLFNYSVNLILTNAEFTQLNDFINLHRKYNRKVLVNIDVDENLGNRIAGVPDTSDTDFTFSDLQITEKTGLYKYVTLSYFNDKFNKVR